MTPTQLAVLALATYRLTRLVVRDELTAPLRERLDPVIDRPGLVGRAAYLALCPWCLSVWTAAAVTTTSQLWPRQARPVLETAAVAGLAGLLLDRDAG